MNRPSFWQAVAASNSDGQPSRVHKDLFGPYRSSNQSGRELWISRGLHGVARPQPTAGHHPHHPKVGEQRPQWVLKGCWTVLFDQNDPPTPTHSPKDATQYPRLDNPQQSNRNASMPARRLASMRQAKKATTSPHKQAPIRTGWTTKAK